MFRNLTIYRLPQNWGISLEALNEQLARAAFAPCGPLQHASRGWTPPRDGDLVHAVGGQLLIALHTQTRLLPASVINDETKKRAAEFEESQGFKPGRKQLREIKERVTEELLAKAFVTNTRTQAWIDRANGFLVIDTSSPAKADALIELLRHSLDEFPLGPFHTNLSPTSAMADWLAGGDAPDGFTIDRDCELKAVSEEKAAVKYVRHPLEGDEVKAHLASGKLPVSLAMTWDDRISFVLTEKGVIKRLSYLDILKEQAEKDAENADDLFDADFALMTGELARFLPALTYALGGEVKDVD